MTSTKSLIKKFKSKAPTHHPDQGLAGGRWGERTRIKSFKKSLGKKQRWMPFGSRSELMRGGGGCGSVVACPAESSDSTGRSSHSARPHVVHASQGLKVGLYTPTILGGNSQLNWFYDRGAITDPAHTGTSKGIAQAIKRGPIRKLLPKYAYVYVTIQSHGFSAGVRTHYVTANGVRNGLP